MPWAAGGVARFSFKDLCEQPLGPADYISIGSAFVSFRAAYRVWPSSACAKLTCTTGQHTIIIDDVPVLPLSAKNEARRLITLLDALCETWTCLR